MAYPIDNRYLTKQLRKRPKPLFPVVPDEEPPKYNLDPSAAGVQPFNPNDFAKTMSAPPLPPSVLAPKIPMAPGAPPIGAGAGIIGAGTQQQQQQMKAAPPPDEGDGNPFDYGSDAGAARAGGTSQPPPENKHVFGAAPTTPGPTPAEPTEPTEKTPEQKKLDDLLAEYEKGQPIEDWKESETQTAADKLAREQDALKARMGGTDNPYAMLGGVAAQGEFLKRKGDINAKEVDMWFKQTQARQNLLTQLEEWNRANKPDLYNQWRDRMIGTFGEGWSWGKDGNTILLGNGKEKRFSDMSQSEKQMVKDYQAAMGLNPMDSAVSPEETDRRHNQALVSIGGMDSSLDTEIDYGNQANSSEITLANQIAKVYEDTGKIPTKAEVMKMYAAAGVSLEGSSLEDGDPNSPAW